MAISPVFGFGLKGDAWAATFPRQRRPSSRPWLGKWRCCKQAGVLSLAVARPGGCRAAGNGRRPGGRPAIDPTVAGGPVSRVQGHRSPVLGAPNTVSDKLGKPSPREWRKRCRKYLIEMISSLSFKTTLWEHHLSLVVSNVQFWLGCFLLSYILYLKYLVLALIV